MTTATGPVPSTGTTFAPERIIGITQCGCPTQNLLNSPPPVDLGTYGSNTSYNPSLAQAGAIGMFFDAGFKFRF